MLRKLFEGWGTSKKCAGLVEANAKLRRENVELKKDLEKEREDCFKHLNEKIEIREELVSQLAEIETTRIQRDNALHEKERLKAELQGWKVRAEKAETALRESKRAYSRFWDENVAVMLGGAVAECEKQKLYLESTISKIAGEVCRIENDERDREEKPTTGVEVREDTP